MRGPAITTCSASSPAPTAASTTPASRSRPSTRSRSAPTGCAAKGREAGWGLGRHTIGSNFFHYNPDPWGSWIEWFSDIDQIDDCWVAGDWDVPPHLWGAPPPETFLANQEPDPNEGVHHEP